LSRASCRCICASFSCAKSNVATASGCVCVCAVCVCVCVCVRACVCSLVRHGVHTCTRVLRCCVKQRHKHTPEDGDEQSAP
jgi:hypothetical protein